MKKIIYVALSLCATGMVFAGNNADVFVSRNRTIREPILEESTLGAEEREEVRNFQQFVQEKDYVKIFYFLKEKEEQCDARDEQNLNRYALINLNASAAIIERDPENSENFCLARKSLADLAFNEALDPTIRRIAHENLARIAVQENEGDTARDHWQQADLLKKMIE